MAPQKSNRKRLRRRRFRPHGGTSRKVCREVFEKLSEFLDGELPARDCRELKRHLEGCRPCLDYLETLRVTASLCRRYGEHESFAPPPELLSRLARWRAARPGRRPLRQRTPAGSIA